MDGDKSSSNGPSSAWARRNRRGRLFLPESKVHLLATPVDEALEKSIVTTKESFDIDASFLDYAHKMIA